MLKNNFIKILIIIVSLMVIVLLWTDNIKKNSTKGFPLDFTRGDTFIYKFKNITTSKSLKGKSSLAGASLFETDIVVKIFNTVNNKIYIGLQLDGLKHSINNKDEKKDYLNILQLPFLLSLNLDGSFHDILFSNQISKNDEKILRSMISLFDFKLVKNKDHWIGKHENPIGQYIAKYQKKDNLKINKQKSKYVDYNNPILIDINSSNITYKIEKKKSWFSTIESKEKYFVLVSNIDDKIKMEQSTLVIKSTKKLSDLILLSFLDEEELRAFLLQKKEKEKNSIKEKLKNQEFVDFINKNSIEIDDLIQLYKDKKLTKHQFRVKLRQYITLYPNKTSEFFGIILNKKVNNKVAMIIVGCLVDIGHEQAQKVLSDILWEEDIERIVRQNLAMMIGFLKEPNNNTLNSLWDYYSQNGDSNNYISSSSILALGNLGERNEKIYKKVFTKLETQLEHTKDTGEIGLLLTSLGNTNNPDILGSVNKFVDNDEHSIRKASIKAIGKIKGKNDEVVKIIHQRLNKETSTSVLAQIGKSLQKKTLSNEVVKSASSKLKLFNPYEQSIDPIPLIQIVTKNIKNVSGSRKDLLYMMTKDYNPRVKKEIIKGLE